MWIRRPAKAARTPLRLHRKRCPRSLDPPHTRLADANRGSHRARRPRGDIGGLFLRRLANHPLQRRRRNHRRAYGARSMFLQSGEAGCKEAFAPPGRLLTSIRSTSQLLQWVGGFRRHRRHRFETRDCSAISRSYRPAASSKTRAPPTRRAGSVRPLLQSQALLVIQGYGGGHAHSTSPYHKDVAELIVVILLVLHYA